MTTAVIADLGRRAQSMLDALAALSDEDGRITRLYLSPAHRRAADLVARWMGAAGMAVSEDALGTVRGHLPPAVPGPLANRRYLVGSHIDTVVDAGRYDGTLGVVAAILAVEEIRARGLKLPFGLDVLAFGDEEGVRFPTTLASSSAVAGVFKQADLDGARDSAGVSLREALVGFGGDPDRVAAAAYAPESVLGYLEVHIEQGPVLEIEGRPLGVVTSIAGQSRYMVTVTGEAGHAGTVPMTMRRDALAASAEMMLAVEAVARAGRADQMVATVGRLSLDPGAVNVIPARVSFTVDLRAETDPPRAAAADAIKQRFREIAEARNVAFLMDRYHDTPTTPASPRIQAAFARAVEDLGLPVRRLTSGAGHDGHAMHALCDIGMLFVRCRAGISHNPNEFADATDMGLAVEALIRALTALADGQGEV
ncbi:allantoate amidohydrolase [Mongoliimonas terrestris]|uniref:allantoate amidohydrolase n=1 Tax=Mongoliimonas terrestris TaxID=1709001 RepID=UPI000A642255|nr:allantoate amidohydrolase [Mongoliimonas terrestris]